LRALAHSGAALSALAAAPLVAGLAAVPRWRIGLRERLGAAPRVLSGAVWVHAASVGEILAAARLVDRLRQDRHRVVTSTFTVSGRDVMRRSRPDIPCHLAPLDHPWCAALALSRVSPAALVLVETELWPSWIAAAQRRGVPTLVISGRVSDRSFPRYRRLSRLVARSLRRLTFIGARTERDAERFLALGAPAGRVSVIGDLKLEVDEKPPALARDLAAWLGEVPLFIAGSTHRGEEDAALSALAAAEQSGHRAALVLAPRQPARADEVASLAASAGRRVHRRGALDGGPLAAGEVLVLDTVGELASLFGRADVAFVGGTLVPRGGHNLLEPVLAGRPVIFGPHTENAPHVAELLQRSSAGLAVADADALAAAVVAALKDPETWSARGAAGREDLARHRGAADRAAARLAEALAAAGRA
jgi:3-deoxy-D-manno-octulosonic-acid transferase